MTIGDILILRRQIPYFACNRLNLYKNMTGKLPNFPLSRLIFLSWILPFGRYWQVRSLGYYRPGEMIIGRARLQLPKVVVKLKLDK
jgi:hypothetical protein